MELLNRPHELETTFDEDFPEAEDEIESLSDGYPASIDSFEEDVFEERLDPVLDM